MAMGRRAIVSPANWEIDGEKVSGRKDGLRRLTSHSGAGAFADDGSEARRMWLPGPVSVASIFRDPSKVRIKRFTALNWSWPCSIKIRLLATDALATIRAVPSSVCTCRRPFKITEPTLRMTAAAMTAIIDNINRARSDILETSKSQSAGQATAPGLFIPWWLSYQKCPPSDILGSLPGKIGKTARYVMARSRYLSP